jgi:propionyl-CoA synthetase
VSELKVSPVLPVEPGLCAQCGHALVKGTNRGTAYLRCTRASWDDRLVKYPRLPVLGCAGFEPAPGSMAADSGAFETSAAAEDQAP